MAESEYFQLVETPELITWKRKVGSDGEERWVCGIEIFDQNEDADGINQCLIEEKIVNVEYMDEASGLKETARAVAVFPNRFEEYMYLRLWLTMPQLRALAASNGCELSDR